MTNETQTDTPFQREWRYIVIKRKDLAGVAADHLVSDLKYAYGVEPVECVVVEHDWPEYEVVWKMIERRVTGGQTQTGRLAEVLDAPTITQAEEWLRGELQSAFQAADPEATHKFDWADFGPYGATDRGKLVIAALSPRIAATQSLSTDLANAQQRVEQLEGENARLREDVARLEQLTIYAEQYPEAITGKESADG